MEPKQPFKPTLSFSVSDGRMVSIPLGITELDMDLIEGQLKLWRHRIVDPQISVDIGERLI